MAETKEQDKNHQQPAPEEAEETFQLTVRLPGKPNEIKIISSPRETILDVKQSIMESPETCAHSCFYLTLNGTRLNDYVELADIDALTAESTLDLVEGNYSEQDVKLHITRLRDLLAGPYKSNPSAVGIDGSLSFLTTVTGEIEEEIIQEDSKKVDDLFSDEPVPEHAFTNKDINEKFQLGDLVPKAFQRDAPECIKSLSLSGWNPVPHQQKLKGDLMYLIVTTLENDTIHITANRRGFFVNQSNHQTFDPTPKRLMAHSLITLLQKCSPLFSQRFSKLQDFITHHHMLEVLPVNTCYPSYPWAVDTPRLSYDPTRSLEPVLNAEESLRDWNDELQSHREMPKTMLQERVLRERLITKLQAEFTEAAVKGAMAVVNGSVLPLNPMEPESSHMYVYNNIFFSKGNDGRGTFETLGADEAAHVATGKDLEGVKLLNSIDPEGLYTLASVIVDYRGIRIVAQSIVPGIFRRQDEDAIIYGSVDNGQTIASDDQFHTMVGQQIAKSLHLQEHKVVDAKDQSVSLYSSMETKGLLGADGRRYLLDLYRLSPVDIGFQESEPDYPHKMTLLRPELMSLFWEHKLRQWIKVKTEAIKAERGIQEATKEDEKKEEEEIKIDVSEFQLNFNTDVFTNVKHADGASKTEEDTIREASKFLKDEVLPSIVLDFASYSIAPLDGEALTKAMHRRGINMRYLGRLAELVSISKDKRIEHILDLSVQEMVVRGSKHLLRKQLAQCSLEESALCVSHFLNCLLGAQFNPKPVPVLPEGSQRNDFAWAQWTPQTVQQALIQQVQLRFRYALKTEAIDRLHFVSTLREICLRLGLQIHARDYRTEPWTEQERAAHTAEDVAYQAAQDRKKHEPTRGNKKSHKKQTVAPAQQRRRTTFVPEDVLNIMPTVKQAAARSVFAEETFEAGKVSMSQGHKQLGLELLLESLALHEQTYGFLHPETSKCYATLAMIYHHSEDRESALDLQRKAVISSERTCGVDHPETIHHYLNLGLFEHAAGRTLLALRYMRHALGYWNLLFGLGHPDSATADNNTGVMLQSIRDCNTSTRFFERACATQEAVLGQDHVITATGYHVLAKAYTLEGDFAKALATEKIAFSVFEKKVNSTRNDCFY
ncbi:clustered mitochondria-domain-containing protein [Sporodiniella umbellata]|nr:clustered mitochondria-domain-containing protein [Sporodiniella umbellata]